jgi:RimJ/RimL family protein N-acetyltransferase
MRAMETHEVGTVTAILTDPRRSELFWAEPRSAAGVVAWLAERSVWMFRRRSDGELAFIGVTDPVDEQGSMQVHGFLAPSAGMSRLTSFEALQLGIAVCFDRLGARRLVATPIEGNEPAARLLKTAGFEREGTLRQAIRIAGRYRDIWLYSFLREGD